MSVPKRTPDEIADVIAAAHRELAACSADLGARIVNAPDTPQGVRDEGERIALIVSLYAKRLGELLPVVRPRVVPDKVA